MTTAADLNEREKAVLKAIRPGYDVLVLVVPMHARVNDFAAAEALATLKKKKLVAFDGRGKFRSVHLTEDGERVYGEVAA